MSLKANVIYSLNFSRKFLNGLIADLQTPDDWFHQPCPGGNHPLWIVGHLGTADARFAAVIDGQPAQVPEGWDELFWFGSEVSSDRSLYPPVEEVAEFGRMRREYLMTVIGQTDDDWFASPPPAEGRFSDAPNMAQMLIFASFHEGMHAGQLTVARRSLGHPPMLQPPPQPATD